MSTDGVATWPGCCCEPEECGPLCLDITQGTNLSSAPSSGASVNGGSLGTVTTGSDGRACFDIPGTGTYSFTVTKSGYRTEVFTFTVNSDDCDGSAIIKTPPALFPTTMPAGCYSYIVSKCNHCIWAGASVNAYYTYLGVDYVMHFTSRYNGMIYVCLPTGVAISSLEFEVIGNGTNQLTRRPATLTDASVFGPGELTGTYNDYYWCWPQFGCESLKPDTLTVTFASGRTFTMTYDHVTSFTWKSTLTPIAGGLYAQGQVFGYGSMDPFGTCGPYVRWFVDEVIWEADAVTINSRNRYMSMDTQPAGFSLYCPVNVKMMNYVGGTSFPTINAYLSE